MTSGPWTDPNGAIAVGPETPDGPLADLAAASEANEHEQRLHPLTLVSRIAAQGPQLVIALIGSSFLMRGDKLIAMLGFVAIAALISLAVSVLIWRRFSYRIGKEELSITSGIVNKNTRSIPYERIQDVNIERKPIARLLGLAVVRLETGSASGAEEGKLDSVSLAEAERLRDIIRLKKSALANPQAPQTGAIDTALSSPASAEPDEADHAPVLFAMDIRRVLTAGLYNFSLVFFAAIGALVQNFDFLIPGSIYDPDVWIEIAGDSELFAWISGTARVVIGLAILSMLIIGGVVTGLIRTLLREYGFVLERTATGVRRRRGLLTLTDVVIPRHRIQAAQIDTGPLKRRNGWYHLRYQSLASDSDKESSHSVVPLGNKAEIDAVLADANIRWALSESELQPVQRILWKLEAALLLPAPVIGIGIAAALVNPLLLLLLPLVALLPVIAYLRWSKHRYALHNGQLYVTNGFWRQRLTLLPLGRIQSVDLVESVFSRAFGSAALEFGVAGGRGLDRLRIRALPRDTAWRLRDALLA